MFAPSYPLAAELGQLEPLVLLEEGVYMKTRRRPAAATLVTSLGVEHRLRRFCSRRALGDHYRRAGRHYFRQMLVAALARRNAAGATNPLAYFLLLAPSFLERDWSEEVAPSLPARRDIAAPAGDASSWLEMLLDRIPAPQAPYPSLVALGRVWLLAPGPKTPGSVYVRADGRTLALSGEYLTLKTLAGEWQLQLQSWIDDAAARSKLTHPEPGEAALRAARETLSGRGALEMGDLLFLPSEPARLGYILPSRYGAVLGCRGGRGLALTAPLRLPPSIPPDGELRVYRRAGDGRWEQHPSVHAVCLGTRASLSLGTSQWHPGLALAAYLRWAAVRAAANGRFHERG